MKTTVGMPVYENEQGYVDTWGVGGDRFGFLPSSMFSPSPVVGQTSPVPLALLSIPPTYNQLGTANAQYGSGTLAGAVGAQQPWNPMKSVTPWVIFGLIVGLWGIHKLYYSDKHRRAA